MPTCTVPGKFTELLARTRPELGYGNLLASLVRPSARDAVPRFRETLRALLGSEHPPVLTASGRAALYLLFRVVPLDTVYLPGFTCWVVLEAARLAGKQVVLLDVEYPSFNVREEEWRRAARRPGIVVVTHQFGFPEDVDAIRSLLGGGGHFVIEDCAGSLLSTYRGESLGNRGDAAIYSFETAKLWPLGGGALTVREPGMLVEVDQAMDAVATPSRERMTLAHILLRRMVSGSVPYRVVLAAYLRRHAPTEGLRECAERLTVDYTARFGRRQAMLGLSTRTGLDARAARRRALFLRYQEGVARIPGLVALRALPGSSICPIRFPFLAPGLDKLAVYHRMRRLGVDLGFSFSYCLGSDEEVPASCRIGREVLNLPLYADIDESEADAVLDRLSRVVAALRAGAGDR